MSVRDMPLRLDSFDLPDPGSAPAEVLGEEARLAAYDEGYAAGWEDCAAAQAREDTQLRADLARHLQALSFTWQEARQHVMAHLAPLLEALVTQVVPQAARESLGAVVVEALMPQAGRLADSPVTIRINPAARAQVERALADAPALPVRIEEEPTLGEAQAYLRFPDAETVIDLDSVCRDILTALRGHVHSPPMMEQRHAR